MADTTVWISFPLPQNEFDSLERAFPGCRFFQAAPSSVDPARIAGVDVLFADEPFADELARQMARLRWLHTTRGGAYPFLSPSVRQRPIQVTCSKGIHGPAFAEFALASIFALAKKMQESWEAQRKRQWKRLIPDELAGRTVGIVGLGTVGSELARKAKALGLRVLATKRTAAEKPAYVDELGPPDFLPSLLARSDFVVLSLAAVPSTENLLGETELRAMKKNAYLINITAAKAVEEKLLVRAVKEGWIAGAALDALPRQPLPPDSELWGLPNVLISARVGGLSALKWEALMPIFCDNLRRFLAGEKLAKLVDKEKGY